ALTGDAERILSADYVLLPGVGDASYAMRQLQHRSFDRLIPRLKQPVLGICVGLQLMCRTSEEGHVACMNIFQTDVRRFPATDPGHKVPHVGWNQIGSLQTSLFDGVTDGAFVYYVHSYYAECCDDTAATTDYILPFSAALARDNFYATQFHPEKSGRVGMQILQNFLSCKSFRP
ncbi:MAG: imidazole glycerol phosphate synthase subunit HisH, partial [Paludibacteraceae bacterium]|nr:imidazole glycerol phosphate synthase subunit HisH [Paludibacteraceae bacterium]